MISSVGNPHVARALRLRGSQRRVRTGRILVEGGRAVAAALQAGRLKDVFVTAAGARRRETLIEEVRAAGIAARAVEDAVMAALTTTTSTPDITGVATLSVGGAEILRDGPWPAMLVRGARDPAALGTMLATAAAFGARTVLQGASTVDLAGPKVVRAAAGAHFALRLGRSTDDGATLAAARAAGAEVVALHPDGAPLYEAKLPDAMMLVVQGEGDRLAEGTLAWVPSSALLPVTQLAALAWYEWARGR